MTLFSPAAVIELKLIITLHPSKNTTLNIFFLVIFLFTLLLAIIATDSVNKNVRKATATYTAKYAGAVCENGYSLK